MGVLRGALVGALGLIVLEAVVTNADSFAGIIDAVAGSPNGHPGLVGRVLSPGIPAVPDLRVAKKDRP